MLLTLASLFGALLAHSGLFLQCAVAADFQVRFEWNYINFTWPSAPTNLQYVPGEDVIAGIKIYENVVYLALPRIKPGARVTLASIPIDANKENPLLSPFPSWEMNSGSACHTIQNVLSMEIDKEGVMWVLDARRVDNNTDCPPKILLLDLKKKGEVVENFPVPESLCPRPCFLNDVVVDGDFAYISDTTNSDPGIFVYHRNSNSAWKARDRSMFGAASAVHFTAQGVLNTHLSHINGVALCCGPDERVFYFMPQTSLHVYAISNSILRNRSIATGGNLHNFITDKGTKQGQSGGMMCDTEDNIYYGILPLNAVGRWNVKEPLETAEIVEKNDEIIKWPDSFALYDGYLFLITNSISKFGKSGIEKDRINFRILTLRTGTKSYIHC